MVAHQLVLSEEFLLPVIPFELQVADVLAGQEPVFLDFVDRYETIVSAASAAKLALRNTIGHSDTNNINDAQLRGDAGLLDDASTVIRRGGNNVATALKQILEPGRPYVLGNNRYFVEIDPRQTQYPRRRNFYLLGKNEEYPIGFGGNVQFDAIQEPIKPASPADIVTLVRDLAIAKYPSQHT